jgi:hypothetical protein
MFFANGGLVPVARCISAGPVAVRVEFLVRFRVMDAVTVPVAVRSNE